MLWPKFNSLELGHCEEETESEELSWSFMSGGTYPGIMSYVVATQILIKPISDSNLADSSCGVVIIFPIFIAFDGQGKN